MANSVQNLGTNKAGTCPHGAAFGACPICSGMGGGSTRMGERPQKAGEWSYHHCVMIGNLMKARDARIEAHEQNLQKHAEMIKAFEQSLINTANKFADFAAKVQNNIIMKPVALVINKLIVPALRAFANIPNIITTVKEKFIDIQDKLNAIFGEAKAFVQKKISELVSVVKSKFTDLFKIFKRNNTKDDETKIDEDKKIFRLKTFLQKILRKDKKGKNDSEN